MKLAIQYAQPDIVKRQAPKGRVKCLAEETTAKSQFNLNLQIQTPATIFH
jgi:hypothetical protein